MMNERQKKRGILRVLRQIHRMFIRIEFIAFPIILLIGVAIGLVEPIVGFTAFIFMLLLAWIYFDAKKHGAMPKSKNDVEKE